MSRIAVLTRRLAGVAGAALALAACGQQPAGQVNGLFGGASSVSAADAVRLAKQASFGPTADLVGHIQILGVSGWLDEQFAANGSTYADLLTRTGPTNRCNALTGQDATNCNRDYLSSTPVQMRFYADAVGQPDQLRQRVAFALSQLLVASDLEVKSTPGTAALQQILLDNAFGNYRDILRAVTLNPYMGDYLDMANSSKAAPNENYARELMQLFSIGVTKLNMDGTPQRDSSGAPVASYTSDDVHSVARALTGWTYAKLNGSTAGTDLDYSKPMVVNAAVYDTTAKSFLGTTVSAGATQDASLNAVVDAVFANASTAPYVARHLIEQLVTSNPSPGYVGRVAAAFANNGAGVRGDMKAVVRAVLTDAEARGDVKTGAQDGKVKEPALLLAAVGRLLAFKSDGYAFITRDGGMGEAPFRAPSVFNFYPPDYPLAESTQGLVSPQGKLVTTGTVLARHNLVYDWTVAGDQTSRGEYTAQAVIPGATGTQVDWSAWQAFGTDVDGMLDRIDLLLLNRTMSPAQRTAVKAAMTAVTNADAATQARKRAQTALYIVASSPQFQIDR